MKHLSVVFVVLLSALVLEVSSCNKEDRRIKKYTKNMESARLWTGSWEINTPVHDSNGQRTGYQLEVKDITDTSVKITVVDDYIIQFGNQEIVYDEVNNIANTILYVGAGGAHQLRYFIANDTTSYAYVAGHASALRLHTK